MDSGPSPLSYRLPFLMDGGMRSELIKLGMPEDACLPAWAAAHAEAVSAIQKAYLDAGAKLLMTPNCGGNRAALAQYGCEKLVTELNGQLARQTRLLAQGRAVVAGGLSSTGLFLPPVGEHGFEEFVDIYRQQAQAMLDSVDLFFLESMTQLHEMRAAVLAVRSLCDKPIFVSVSCDDEGRLHGSGTDALAALIVMQGMGVSAFGIGCTSVEVTVEQLERLNEFAMIPLLAKPCGPLEAPQSTARLATAGARMFGGCCGTSAKDIFLLGTALKNLDFTALPVPHYTADPDVIACASSHEARFITPDVDVGEPVECSGMMLEDILQAELRQTCGAIKVLIRDEEDLQIFAENQYAVKEALCIETEEPELMEGALRLFQGRAFYDGMGGLPEGELERMRRVYGLVIL